ncbi:adenylate kinase 7-like isoform X3 [Melanotaenia boesemani]|uniref:adenylate kinase 7-like isoform X3 n=1 Tax=Melanotaenia boesemani TaxID=1250792 RepID=UPI001C054BEE|nr:adenylate kinase 7-like isoform X3 [Melanotaenia boesemani]
MAEKKQQSRPKRIFVNDVDSYSSKHIAKLLSKCEAGKTSEDEEAELGPLRGEPPFYIVGTVSSSLSNDGKLDFVREQYTFPSRDELFQLLLECDVVVYNISESSTQQQVEEAEWAITALHAEMANFKSRKMFILVSTVMTWVMTKLPHLDDIEPLISEEDFRYKMPHPSFRNHNKVEKLVLKLAREKKSKLKCYVISSGIQYGMGENLFHYFFKVSWLMQLPKVPIFGQGTNHIPMIHVYDLGGVIQNIIEQRPKSKYILATDDSKNTLQTIVKVISDVLGPEKVQKFSLQDAITMKAFKPIRICLVGPPAVGKTTVAEKLCQHYQIHHITIKGIIEEKITQLNGLISGADPECVNEEAAAAAQKQLESINKSLEINQGRLTEEQVFDILQNKLYSKPCRNQGFVLDGFPKTYSQAQIHFFDMERQDSDVMPNKPQYNKLITPEHVFALDASDDFLMKRVQGLPESVAVKMRYTQDEFVPRLSRYRQLSNAEETLLDFFDQREIHPEHIEVNADDPEYTDVIKKIMESVGVPKNYGLSPEKQKEEDQKREDERKQKLTAETAKNKQRKEAALAEMVAQYEEWQKNLSEVTRQECELLEACSLPLRNYLMKYIIPSLTEAMTECCKIKPEDPVDFVAEYLLRSNQE